MGANPEVIAGAARVVLKYAHAGFKQFQVMIEHMQTTIGQPALDKILNYLELAWDKAQASGRFPGMEPRIAAEQPTPVEQEQAVEKQQTIDPEDLTSIKKEVVNKMREERGLPEREGPVPETVEQWAEEARITLANDPMAAIRLVNQVGADPARPLTEREVTLLQFQYRKLQNERNASRQEYFDAVAAEDSARIVAAKTDLVNSSSKMAQFEDAIRPAGTASGRSLAAFKTMLREDFSLGAILSKGQEANSGKELNKEQSAELTAMSEKLEEIQAKLDAQTKLREAAEAELAAQKQHEEVVKEVKTANVRKKTERRQKAEKRVEEAWKAFNSAAAGQASSGIPVNLLPPAVELAKAYADLGVVRLGEFLAYAKQRLGKQFNEEVFTEAWDKVNVEAPDLASLDDIELSREARRIQRGLVEAGMTDRDAVTAEVHKILSEELPGLTMRNTMDALSRYGQFSTPSKDEISKLIRGMNSELLKLSQIDQLEIAMQRAEELRAEGKSDEEIGNTLAKEDLLVKATGLVRDQPGQVLRQLTQKYNELKKSIPATTQGKEGLLQTTLSQIERGLLNRISDLQFEINRNERVVREKRERPTSDKVKALEAERDALLKIHREMFPPNRKAMTEAQKISNAVKAADRAIETLEKQLETRDFDREKHVPLSSPELNSRRARLEQLRAAKKAAQAMEVARMEGEGAPPTGKKPLSKEEIARRVYEATLTRKIADFQQILASGDFAPKPKKPVRTISDAELKLKRQYDDVRSKVLEKYAEYELAHMSPMERTADFIREISNVQRALATSVDISPFGRQGGPVAYSHPILAANVLKEVVTELYRQHNKADIAPRIS